MGMFGAQYQGPSAAYTADKSAKYPGQGVPGNPRPSEFHWWIPGQGWAFFPEYDAGFNLNQQYAAMNPVDLDKAKSQGYQHQMSASSQAVADAQGITVTTGPQYGYTAQYPENQVTNNTTTTGSSDTGSTNSTPATDYTDLYKSQVTNLYYQHLGRAPLEAGLNYWVNDMNNGQTLAQVEYNIMNSQEYLTNKANADAAAAGGEEEEEDTTTITTPGGDQPTLTGYYWGLGQNNGWGWFPYYSNEAPPAGAFTSGPDAQPSGAPEGWTNPNLQPNPDTTGGDETTETPAGPNLYTPRGDQFYQGMFTANDMLFRDGGTIDSSFYNNLRQNVLAGLAQTAADNGRTQNTAEEIALAQGNGGYSASGLFDPSVAGLYRSLGI